MSPRLALLPLFLAGCPGPPAPAAGARVFRDQGCGTCHAADGSGTSFGPDLRGQGLHWTAAQLAEYLRNPQEYAAKDARLSAQGRKYSLPMPRYDKLPPGELAALADHLLGL